MKRVLVIAVLLPVLVAACSPYRITRNQADRSAAWSAYRTFAFVDTSRISPVPGEAYRTAMEQIKQAVSAELRNRGYQPTRDNPDLLVNLGAVVKEKTQTRQTTIQEAPRYIGQRRYSWQSQEVPVGTYNEGTVNLHVVDAQRNALVWDVAVSSVLSPKGVNQKQINQAVAKVFEKFPGKN
ncbi:DUF4136 domain-containing protein [Spirosoma montaniterrae]|uniref:DUF4136 domain-containing protein n=1 Tax=Spirosoma montaniterrae TaxID=1178516 RepID=A0A1P9WU34_9BACT|nr:DUF4136 domain-containing protein [Spirosoma montaniterrae]AQG78843.1 hypothetical protein AWR27_05605 [Spirosoma montaniterrae]